MFAEFIEMPNGSSPYYINRQAILYIRVDGGNRAITISFNVATSGGFNSLETMTFSMDTIEELERIVYQLVKGKSA